MEGKLTIDDGSIEKQRPAKIMTNKLDFIKKNILTCLLKDPNSAPFVIPVNHKLLNIPDYPRVIKCPIDLSKIKARLRSKYYYNAEECLADFDLMFANCYAYNLPGTEVVDMGILLQKLLDEKIKLLPVDEYQVNFSKKRGESGKRGRNSGSNMKSDLSSIGSGPNSVASGKNIKTAAESCYDMSPTPSPKNKHKEENELKRPRLTEELRLCGNVLKEITSIRYRHLNELFLEPVLKKFPALTDYAEIVKNPMDLGTIKTKLENYQYKTKADFMIDINLMFDNCYAYNGAESSVSQLARDLRRKFDETYTKIFGLNKQPTQNNQHHSASHSHTSSVHSTNNQPVFKSEPIITVSTSADPKAVLETYQKDLKQVINAILILDNNLKRYAESQELPYESVLHMLPQMNGTTIKRSNHSSSHHSSKKRKISDSTDQPSTINTSSHHKRGRKSHKQSHQVNTNTTTNIIYPPPPVTTTAPISIITTPQPNNYTISKIDPLLEQTKHTPPTQPLPHPTPIIQPVVTTQTPIPPPIPAPVQVAPQAPLPPQQIEPDTSPYTSWDARRNLSLMIEKLSGKQLGRVIEIIKENEAAYSDWNLDELDIDFEVLLPKTLTKLYQFVQSTYQNPTPTASATISTPIINSNLSEQNNGLICEPDQNQHHSHATNIMMNTMTLPNHTGAVPIQSINMPHHNLTYNQSELMKPTNNNPNQPHHMSLQQQSNITSQQFMNNSNSNALPNHQSLEDGQISDSSSNSSESSSSKSDDEEESSDSDSESES